MQLYQFEKIYSEMAKEFGKIKKGDEGQYEEALYAFEFNVLGVYRKNPKSNSRRLREAIALALFDVKMRCTGETIDIEKFRNEDNEKLEKALLMTFDPLSNIKIMNEVKHKFKNATKEELIEFYTVPVMCMLRIKDSIDMWEKENGANGYFEFLQNFTK